MAAEWSVEQMWGTLGGIARLAEHWAEKFPDGLALACLDERISWSELNASANRYAAWFANRGVGREDVVAAPEDLCVQIEAGDVARGGAFAINREVAAASAAPRGTGLLLGRLSQVVVFDGYVDREATGKKIVTDVFDGEVYAPLDEHLFSQIEAGERSLV